jgi:hypothetical protein
LKLKSTNREGSAAASLEPAAGRRAFMRLAAGAAAVIVSGCGGGSGGAGDSAARADSLATVSTGVAASFAFQQPVENAVTLQPGFASLSFEKSHINTSGNVYFGSGNTNLIGLFNRIGPGVLRIGANSVDRMTWTPNGAGQTSGQVSQVDVSNLAAFLRQCPGWKVIYGINFAGAQGSTASPTLAGQEAAFVVQQLGSQLLAFEIGNEPNEYGNSNTPGLAGITYDIFLNGGTVSQGTIQGWNQFASAIRTAAGSVPLSGPAAANDKNMWPENFAVSEAGKVALITEHYYISNYNTATPSIAGLLTYPDTNLVTVLKNLQTASQENNVPYRMDETNSYFSSTDPAGISNAFASALWGIDFIFTHAQYGASGLNLHSNGTVSSYTVVGDDGKGNVTAVQPLFYALAFFSQIFAGGATGTLLNGTLNPNGVALSAFAIASNSGATYVVLNNKDTAQTANVSIAVGNSATQATVMTLASSGATPSAQLANTGIYNGGTAITLGGQAVGLNGGRQAASQQTLSVTDASVTVSVAPASAALVRIH